jgi:hypothetical protein
MDKIIASWRSVMDSEVNPLRTLPPSRRYQIMIALGLMWSVVFCAMIGILQYAPYYFIAHVFLVFCGAVITNGVFRAAEANKLSHRDQFRRADGMGARYDDIWGG